MRNLFFISLLVVGLNACSGVSYMDRQEYAKFTGNDNTTKTRQLDFGAVQEAKSLGALSFDVTGTGSNPVIVDLRRAKKFFYGETRVYVSDNKEKSFFDESSVSFGMDKKSKGASIELSLKF